MFVGIVTPPLIVASAIGLNPMESMLMVNTALLASGITTFIQVKKFGPFGSGTLSVQGTSFTFVPLAIQAGKIGGMPLILGLSIAAAPLQMILSRFLKFTGKIFPPVVTGCVILLLGLTLVRVAMVDFAGGAGAADFGSPNNLLLGTSVIIVILLCQVLKARFLRNASIAMGIFCGYLLAAFWGKIDFSLVQNQDWFSWSIQPFHYGLSFDWALLIPWFIAYFLTTIESIGDLSATAAVSRQPVSGPVYENRIKSGILADGLGSMIAGMLNSLPNTTFSQNNGVIRLTGVASRRVGYMVALILASLSFSPKLGALILIMPKPVLGGASLILFGMVTISGLRMILKAGLNHKNELILATSLSIGIGVILSPASLTFVADTSPFKAVLESGLAMGSLTALILNLIIPQKKDHPQAILETVYEQVASNTTQIVNQ